MPKENWYMTDDTEGFACYPGVTTREQARRRAQAIRREHGERLNAQHTEAQDWGPSGHPAFSNTPAQDAAKRKKARSNMKTKLELRNIAASVSEELVSVRCKYSKDGKWFTFLCPTELAGELEEGDLVNVSSKGNSIEVVTVAKVDPHCDLDDLSLVYQWVLGKVDMTKLDVLRNWYETAGDTLARAQRRKARQAMLQEMDIGGVPPLALTSGVSGEVIDAEDEIPDTTQG